MCIYKFAFIILLSFSIKAMACVTPLFRYALEEWSCDMYRVTVFYKPGTLSAHVGPLKPLISATTTSYGQWPDELKIKPDLHDDKANIVMRFVNIDEPMKPILERLWNAQRDSEVPWMIIRYPSSSRMMHPLWSGPVADFKLAENFIDSPARQQIRGHLLDGETAVWLLLKTNDAKANKKAMQTIHQGLELAKKELRLPKAVYEKDDNVLSGTTAYLWKISFQTMSISRTDEDEVPFITMMIKSNPDLMKQINQPIAFVIYGRCRALKGIPASRLTKQMILETNRFLLESCQCQVKDQNPGTDMLIKADWSEFEEKIAGIKRKDIPLRGITDFIEEYNDDSDEQIKKPVVDSSNGAIQSQAERHDVSDDEAGSLFQIKNIIVSLLLLAMIAFGIAYIKTSRKSG